MWPSFSLWACRILKIRSCLRMPLAPGRSSVRAILVNSVMFFSLSSAMVMSSPARRIRNYREGVWEIGYYKAGGLGCLVLSSPPLCLNKMFGFGQNRLLLGACNPIQNLVHGLLDSGIRLVKLACSLGGKLAEHIPVPQSMQCIENTIRAHDGECPFFAARAFDGLRAFGKHLSIATRQQKTAEPNRK